MGFIRRHEPLFAAAIIMIAVMAGWLAMPSIMRLISGGGPFAGLAVALAFILSFFAVLWLRARHQHKRDRT